MQSQMKTVIRSRKQNQNNKLNEKNNNLKFIFIMKNIPVISVNDIITLSAK